MEPWMIIGVLFGGIFGSAALLGTVTGWLLKSAENNLNKSIVPLSGNIDLLSSRMDLMESTLTGNISAIANKLESLQSAFKERTEVVDEKLSDLGRRIDGLDADIGELREGINHNKTVLEDAARRMSGA